MTNEKKNETGAIRLGSADVTLVASARESWLAAAYQEVAELRAAIWGRSSDGLSCDEEMGLLAAAERNVLALEAL